MSRTLVGTYLRADGTPEVGKLVFSASCAIKSATAHILPNPTSVRLVAGSFSITLETTDDSAWTPAGWTWKVTEKIEGGRTFYFNLASGVTDINITELAPLSAPPGVASYAGPVGLTGATGATGATGPQGSPYVSLDAVQMKGGNISAWATDEVAGVAKILADIERLGLNTVTLPVRCATPNVSSNSVTIDVAQLAFAHVARAALPDGIRVIVEPYPWVADGTESETLWEPTNIATWFANWGAACVQIAQEFPNEYGMYVSSNMPFMQDEWASWQDLIVDVRAQTDALIAFRTNWWYTADFDAGVTSALHVARVANPVWEFVDIVAISGYFELNESDDPGWEELMSDLHCTSMYSRDQNVYDEIQMFVTEWGKDWWFGELVCSFWTNAVSAPWNPDSGATRSRMIQYNWFKAYTQTFNAAPGYRGFSVFNIGHPYTDGGYELERPAVRYLKSIPTI